MSNLALVTLVGVCIGFGQYCFALFVRGLPPTPELVPLAVATLRSPWLYGTVALYGSGVVFYGLLLRQATLISANISIIVIVAALSCVFSLLLGEKPSMAQWIGVGLAIPSIVLLRG
ncbi:MAG: hypothetical protein ABJG86_01265 [Nitratireductor sp.]|uniref:hypothetical protein n=1 Tax=Alphaproteobacteria TaxID=28211 RepID=UPI00328566CC